MVANNERDNLLKIRVRVGDVAVMAIIDTGSQANLISERVFAASGLMRTEEPVMPMVGAFGGSGTCIGKLEWVPLYITTSQIKTWGSTIGVLKNPPFDMILGQTWITGNKVSIEQRPEGVYLSLIHKGKKVLINVCPNPKYLRRNESRKDEQDVEMYTILTREPHHREKIPLRGNPEYMKVRRGNDVQELCEIPAIKNRDAKTERLADTRMELRIRELDQSRHDEEGSRSKGRFVNDSRTEVDRRPSEKREPRRNENPTHYLVGEAKEHEADSGNEESEEEPDRGRGDYFSEEGDRESESDDEEESFEVSDNGSNDPRRLRVSRSPDTRQNEQGIESQLYDLIEDEEDPGGEKRQRNPDNKRTGRSRAREGGRDQEWLDPRWEWNGLGEDQHETRRIELVPLIRDTKDGKIRRSNDFQEIREAGKETIVGREPEFGKKVANARMELEKDRLDRTSKENLTRRKNERNRGESSDGDDEKLEQRPTGIMGRARKEKADESPASGEVIEHAARARIWQYLEKQYKRTGDDKTDNENQEDKKIDEGEDDGETENSRDIPRNLYTNWDRRYRRSIIRKESRMKSKEGEEESKRNVGLDQLEDQGRNQGEEREDEEEKPRQTKKQVILRGKIELSTKKQQSKIEDRSTEAVSDSENEGYKRKIVEEKDENLGRRKHFGDERVEGADKEEDAETEKDRKEGDPRKLTNWSYKEYHSLSEGDESEATEHGNYSPDDEISDDESDEEVQQRYLEQTDNVSEETEEESKLSFYHGKRSLKNKGAKEIRSPQDVRWERAAHSGSQLDVRSESGTLAMYRTPEETIRLIRTGVSEREQDKNSRQEGTRANMNPPSEDMKSDKRDNGRAVVDEQPTPIEPKEKEKETALIPTPLQKRKVKPEKEDEYPESRGRWSTRRRKLTFKADRKERKRWEEHIRLLDGKTKEKYEPPRILTLVAQTNAVKSPGSIRMEEEEIYVMDLNDSEYAGHGDQWIIHYDDTEERNGMYLMISHEDRRKKEWSVGRDDTSALENKWVREWTERICSAKNVSTINRRVRKKRSESESDASRNTRVQGNERNRDIEFEGKTRVQGKVSRNRIKERRIGLEELTNPSLYERYWHSGTLRPKTSLFINSAEQSMNVNAQSFYPRNSTHQQCDMANPTTSETLYPPFGLILPWNGVILVRTSVVALTKKVLSQGQQQITATIAGATTVVADPETLKKETYRGRATITFEEYPRDTAAGVPHPNEEALEATWRAIFNPYRPPPGLATAPPPPNPRLGTVPLPGLGNTNQEVSVRGVRDGRIKKYSPKSRKQNFACTSPIPTIGVGTPKDPIDVDEATAFIEMAIAHANPANPPSYSPANSKQKTLSSQEGMDAPSEEALEDMEEWVSRLERELEEMEEDDLPTTQDIASSVGSSVGDGYPSFAELAGAKRPDNPEPPELPYPEDIQHTTDSPMADDFNGLKEKGELREGRDYGPAIPDDRDKLVFLHMKAQKQDESGVWQPLLTTAQPGAEPISPLALDGLQTSPTPDSLPDLVPISDTTASSRSFDGEEPTLTQAIFEETLKETPNWKKLVDIMTKEITVVESKIKEVDDLLKAYFPDPYKIPTTRPPWTAPYATWTVFNALEAVVADQKTFAYNKAKDLEAFHGEFEGYRDGMTEQLDRRFNGLKHSSNAKMDAKVDGLEEWIAEVRNEGRTLGKQLGEDRAKWEKTQQLLNLVQIDFGRTIRDSHGSIVSLIGTNTTNLEKQINVICDIIGIPRIAPSTAKMLEAEETVTKDPRKVSTGKEKTGYADSSKYFSPTKYYTGLAF